VYGAPAAPILSSTVQTFGLHACTWQVKAFLEGQKFHEFRLQPWSG